MAQSTLASAKPTGRKRETCPVPAKRAKKRPALPRLYYPLDARVLRTPFRAKVLETIYEIAHRELGDSIESAVVLTNVDYEEPYRIMLVLAIWVDVDKDEWSRASRAISDAVFVEESSWTEEERDDYLNMIHFEILPLQT